MLNLPTRTHNKLFRLLIPCRYDTLNRDVVCETCPIGYEVCSLPLNCSTENSDSFVLFRVGYARNVLGDIHANWLTLEY